MRPVQSGQSSWQKNYAMNLPDISILLGYVGIYDLRVQVDELKVRAWAQSLDATLPLDESKKIVSWHYANYDTAINPSHLNREWRRRLADAQERERGNLMSLEFIANEKNKATPEFVAQVKKDLMDKWNRGKDASLEIDSGEVAPNP